MALTDSQLIDERCACGATFRLTGYIHSIVTAASNWRVEHVHEVIHAASPPKSVKDWLAENRN